MAGDKWRQRIQRAREHERKWRERARKVLDVYRDEHERDGTQFNILWSNTETLRPALYLATPKPDIRRRYRDQDPVARLASTALERCASFQIDQYDFDGFAKACVNDYLLPGRAVARVRYIPTFNRVPGPRIALIEQPILDASGMEVGVGFFNGEEKFEGEPDFDENGPYTLGDDEDELVYEEVRDEYVLWDDFVMEPARRWEDVSWIAFRSCMTEDDLKREYPKADVDSITFAQRKEGENGVSEEPTAELWEIWDKRTRRVYVIASGMDGYLADNEDPLELEDFYPIPKPLYAIETNGSLLPVPEYTLYQDQAEELNEITRRISRLIEAIKARGAYPGAEGSKLETLLSSDELTLVPIDDWQGFAEKGGFQNMISWVPIEQFGKTLNFLMQKRGELIQSIYELTGISDIMRGASDPRETNGAQQLKARFGGNRLRPRQMAVATFFRDLLRIKVEIMAEKFQPETIAAMSGLDELRDANKLDEVMQLIRDDARRNFAIDIETDSTLAADEAQDKQDVLEFYGAVSTMAAQIAPLMKTPNDKLIFKELLLYGVRRFKVGRNIEPLLEQMGKEPPPQPQQPDPTTALIMAEIERRNAESQQEMKLEMQQFMEEERRKNAEAAQELQIERERFANEQARKNLITQARVQDVR